MPTKNSSFVIRLFSVLIVFALLFGTTGVVPAHAGGGPSYVKPAATGTGDCSSWANACTLQTALTSAVSGDELWVMAGTHKPTTDTDRSATFQLQSGVAVYGGFAGTEMTLGQRDPLLNITILDGNIGASDSSDNSYHVVTGATGATLDGFTITAGNANGTNPHDRGGGMYNPAGSNPTLANLIFFENSTSGSGGGLYNYSASPALTNISFVRNSATLAGGGIYNYGNSSTLTNVTFSNNSANSGGGMCNSTGSSPILTNVTFSANSASHAGGGMYNISSSPVLTTVTFSANSAGSYGGGMYNYKSNPTLTNVTFSDNTANSGGGMRNDKDSSPALTDVTFSANSAYFGGGLYNDESSPTLTNVTFSSNSATGAGGGIHNDGSSPTLTDVTFSSNDANYGAGMNNSSGSSATLTNVTFSSNSATQEGGGMFNSNSSPALTNVTFSSNVATTYGGGMNNSAGSPTLTNVAFNDNSADRGGGMRNSSGSSPILTEVTFTGNTAVLWGGGMYNDESSPTLTDVTFNGNTATHSGGGMRNGNGSNPTLTNVTFTSNNANYGAGISNSTSSPALTNVTFSQNSAAQGGGMSNSISNPTLTNVTFSQNSAELGGGMYNYDSNPTLTNVTFSTNSAVYSGGGMYNETSAPTLTNVTFNLNEADWGSDGMLNDDSSPTIRNTILWGNSSPDSLQITDYGGSAPIVSDSVIQGGYAGGANIITSDPLLGTLGSYGGYTQTIPLQAASSAIDTGSAAVCPASDQRGVSRPQGAGCDIGAYEYVPADFTKSAPANAATGQPLSPTLSWQASSGATSYEYCYSSAPGPCTKWNSVGSNTSVALSGLAPGYTYYWQVRAVDAGGPAEANDGVWWSFTTTAAPACTWPSYTPPTAPTFGDVPMDAGHWSWVERLANSAITAGCGAGNYCPFNEVNRAQMAIFLLRGKHCGSSYIPPAVGDSTGFGDVPLDATYAPWVKQLAAEGVTAGCGNGNFCPLQVVSRAQMAIFLLRAKHGSAYSPPAVGATTGFADVPLDATYAAWVKQLAAEGVTAGCGNGNFCPLQNVNRAQMATFLVRAFGLP